jgi:hypothetical protein
LPFYSFTPKAKVSNPLNNNTLLFVALLRFKKKRKKKKEERSEKKKEKKKKRGQVVHFLTLCWPSYLVFYWSFDDVDLFFAICWLNLFGICGII